MKIENAVKKLSKYTKVENNGNQYYGVINNNVVSFIKNGGDSNNAICFHIKRVGEEHDLMSDYHCGSYCDNLTQAIKLANGI